MIIAKYYRRQRHYQAIHTSVHKAKQLAHKVGGPVDNTAVKGWRENHTQNILSDTNPKDQYSMTANIHKH